MNNRNRKQLKVEVSLITRIQELEQSNKELLDALKNIHRDFDRVIRKEGFDRDFFPSVEVAEEAIAKAEECK